MKVLKYNLNLIVMIMTIAAITVISNAQSKVSWKEKDDFHAVMSATFHPSEDGNLEPIKKRSGELVQRAKEWMNSTPPKEFENAKVKKTLKKLYKKSVALDKIIKNGASDDKIKKSLAALHDIFHEIVEICSHKDGDGH